MPTLFEDSVHVRGHVSCETMDIPDSTIVNADVSPSANIDDSKTRHRFEAYVSQAGTIAADKKYIKIMRASGVVLKIEAAVTETIATGADREVTVDLKKSTAGGAFASILTAPITLDDASVLRTAVAGAIASSALVDGDILLVETAVAGAAGAQAEGLAVSVQVSENPA